MKSAKQSILVNSKAKGRFGCFFNRYCLISGFVLLLILQLIDVAYATNPAPREPGPTISVTMDAVSGSRYRKIALNGRPMADEKPHHAEETDEAKEETYVDAMTLSLRHSTTDIYVPIPGSTLSLSVRRNAISENWNIRSGFRPGERADRPFGEGWTSNLTPNVDLTCSGDGVVYANVVDENGSQHRFLVTGSHGGTFVPMPTSAVESGDLFCSLTGDVEAALVKNSEGIVTGTAYLCKNFIFTGKYGNSVAYEPTEVTRFFGSTRWPSEGLEEHNYFRAKTVSDRAGNSLNFTYSGSNTLIPSTVSLNNTGADPQSITISTDPVTGCISKITAPDNNNNNKEFIYITGSGLVPITSCTYFYLSAVNKPDNGVVSYKYDSAEESDNWTIPTAGRVNKHHFDLGSVKYLQSSGKEFEYVFSYAFDQSHHANTTSGNYRQTGLPRNVSKVILPAIPTVYNGQAASGTTTFINGSDLKISGITYDSINSKCETSVTDACGKTTKYTFSNAGTIWKNEVIYTTTVPLIVYFVDMKIVHPGTMGEENYSFDPAAGLALKSATDMYNNTTTYEYGITMTTGTAGNAFPGFGNFSDDPTKESRTSPSGPVSKTFTYNSATHIMTDSVDEKNRHTHYDIDGKGRRTWEIIYDANGDILKATKFEYDSIFPGVVTTKTVSHNAPASNPAGLWSGALADANDLVTSYALDGLGRVKTETTYPGGDKPPIVTEYTYNANGNKLTAKDPNGNTTQFDYDACNRLKVVTYQDSSTKKYEYDLCGNKTQETDENNHVTNFVYDGLNRLTETHRVMGSGVSDLVTRNVYNAVNFKIAAIDARQNVTEMEYDALGRLTKTTAPADDSNTRAVTRLEYGQNSGNSCFDTSGFKPTKIKGPQTIQGTATPYEKSFVYDSLYREIRREVQYGSGTAVTLTDHDAVGNVTQVTDPNKKITKTDYDGLNRPFAVHYCDENGNTQASVGTSYTRTGLKWKTTDELNRETVTQYDGAGRPVLVISPLVDYGNEVSMSSTTQTIYDNAGNVTGVKNPLGYETNYGYNNRNRKIAELAPAVLVDGNSTPVRPLTKWDYDCVGNVTAVTKNLTGTKNLAGEIESYDTGDKTQTEYDFANRPWKITGPSVPIAGPWFNSETSVQPVTHTYYDANGNITDIQNPKSYWTHNAYDALNRLSTTTTGTTASETTTGTVGITVGYAYDLAGNRVRVTDGNLHSTVFEYDGLNRVTLVTPPTPTPTTGTPIQATSFGYDGLDKVSRTDGKGTTNYSYDYRHRLKTVTYPASTVGNRDYNYDLVGNLLNVTESGKDGKANVTYTYDGLNRMTSENSGGTFDPATNSCTGGLTHSYTYDLAGNRISAQYAGDAVAIAYTYDELNRLSAISENGRLTSYGYDLSGNLSRRTLPNGDIEWMRYDAANRKIYDGCWHIFFSPTAGEWTRCQYSFSYGHDLAGNLSQMYGESNMLEREVGYPVGWEDPYQDLGIWNYRYQEYAYDGANRLTRENTIGDVTGQGIPGEPPPFGDKYFTYDDANNRTSFTDPATGALMICGYNALNQIISLNTDGTNGYPPNIPAAAAKSVVYSYDDNGNRTTRHSISEGTTDNYSYDPENRLTGVTTGLSASSNGKKYAYTYDYRTRRVERVEDVGGENETATRVVFSGGVSVKEYEAGVSTVEYIRGHEMGGGVGGILYSNRGTTTAPALSFDHYNIRGDVIAKTTSEGLKTWTGWYDAFGTHTRERGTTPADRQRANTKEEDPTGLLNEGFRYRDLETGVFLTADPAGMVDGPNLYTYVRQNPWSQFDPEGLWLEDLVIGVPSLIMGGRSLVQNIKSGNIGSAVLDGVGMVADVGAIALPGVPGGAGLAIKAGRLATKGASKIDKVANVAKGVVDTVEAAKNGDVTGAIVDGVQTAVGAKGLVPGPKSAKTVAKEVPKKPCFAAGTKVATPQGEKNIEDIKKGDEVYAFNFETGKTVERKVTDTPRNFTFYWVDVSVGGQSIKATRKHRFWVENLNQWVYAAELEAGMMLRLSNGGTAKITGVSIMELSEPETTYNLEVDQDHDYFVGENVEVLVHNGYPESPQYPPPTKPGQNFQFNFDTSKNMENSRGAGVRRAQQQGTTEKGQIGHHINSVKSHPNLAAEPDNIEGVNSRAEHLEKHDGNYQNSTSGPLKDKPGC